MPTFISLNRGRQTYLKSLPPCLSFSSLSLFRREAADPIAAPTAIPTGIHTGLSVAANRAAPTPAPAAIPMPGSTPGFFLGAMDRL